MKRKREQEILETEKGNEIETKKEKEDKLQEETLILENDSKLITDKAASERESENLARKLQKIEERKLKRLGQLPIISYNSRRERYMKRAGDTFEEEINGDTNKTKQVEESYLISEKKEIPNNNRIIIGQELEWGNNMRENMKLTHTNLLNEIAKNEKELIQSYEEEINTLKTLLKGQNLSENDKNKFMIEIPKKLKTEDTIDLIKKIEELGEENKKLTKNTELLQIKLKEQETKYQKELETTITIEVEKVRKSLEESYNKKIEHEIESYNTKLRESSAHIVKVEREINIIRQDSFTKPENYKPQDFDERGYKRKLDELEKMSAFHKQKHDEISSAFIKYKTENTATIKKLEDTNIHLKAQETNRNKWEEAYNGMKRKFEQEESTKKRFSEEVIILTKRLQEKDSIIAALYRENEGNRGFKI